jgi:acetyl esterase/lipase
VTRRSVVAATASAAAMSQSILQLDPPPPGERLAYGPDPNQFGELRRPAGRGPHPVVIFIHGGYWRARYDLTHTGHLCVAMNRAGWVTWSLEYRRIGQPGGGWPGTFEDVLAGAARLAKIDGVDLSRVVVSGHSAGGQLALYVAAKKPLKLLGVTALAPVADLRRGYALRLSEGVIGELLGGSPEEQPKRYAAVSPVELLPIATRQRLVHGEADTVVPIELSERFAAASRNAELIRPEAGHFEVIDPRAKAWPEVERAILRWS